MVIIFQPIIFHMPEEFIFYQYGLEKPNLAGRLL
jgi:hypothetical protein